MAFPLFVYTHKSYSSFKSRLRDCLFCNVFPYHLMHRETCSLLLLTIYGPAINISVSPLNVMLMYLSGGDSYLFNSVSSVLLYKCESRIETVTIR